MSMVSTPSAGKGHSLAAEGRVLPHRRTRPWAGKNLFLGGEGPVAVFLLHCHSERSEETTFDEHCSPATFPLFPRPKRQRSLILMNRK